MLHSDFLDFTYLYANIATYLICANAALAQRGIFTTKVVPFSC